MTTAKQIIKKIGNANLNLYHGKDYWYFVYSCMGEFGDAYEDRSIYTPRINDMPLEFWVEQGREVIAIAQTWEQARREEYGTKE